MSLLGKWPYRCQLCNMRFNGPPDPVTLAREHAPPPEEDDLDDELPHEAGDKPKE